MRQWCAFLYVRLGSVRRRRAFWVRFRPRHCQVVWYGVAPIRRRWLREIPGLRRFSLSLAPVAVRTDGPAAADCPCRCRPALLPCCPAGLSVRRPQAVAGPEDAAALAGEIHAAGMRAGLALAPETDAEAVLPLLRTCRHIGMVRAAGWEASGHQGAAPFTSRPRRPGTAFWEARAMQWASVLHLYPRGCRWAHWP